MEMNRFQRIQYQYQNLKGDSTGLFSEIFAISKEIGLEEALALLEKCAIEKRIAWVAATYIPSVQVEDPLQTGFDWFYKHYLHLAIPQDGEIVTSNPERITARWWNRCPTLDACLKLGLDTRVVCRVAYHKPVDEFLKHIHPQLRFERNYECIRPYAGYCEETIRLDLSGSSSSTG
jgi:hypothetical protein